MKKLAALTSLILGLVAAAPALGAEQPLLLVVSDFDAALQRGQPADDDRTAAAATASGEELERILALLRQTRSALFEQPGPAAARPH